MIEYKKPLVQEIGAILLRVNGRVSDKELDALRKCSVKVLKEILIEYKEKYKETNKK